MGEGAPTLRCRAGPPSEGWSAIQETGIWGRLLCFWPIPRTRRSGARVTSFIGWHMHIDTISALGLSIRVGTTSVREPRRPLLVFNGIGASIELVGPFTEAMQRVGIPSVVFDVPGVGGSKKTLKPYRF